MAKITYEDKVGITPRTVHINQVWDDDMTEIKNVVNGLDTAVNSINSGGTNPISVSAIWGVGFTFNCTAYSYPINDEFYTANPTTVTLSGSDATLDRIDLIVAKIPTLPSVEGTIQVIEGDLASTELVVPPDYDPSVYFVIKQVIVRATATQPTDINGNPLSTEVVYADGIGEPTEWTFSSNNASVVNVGGVIDATNPTFKHRATMVNDAIVTNLNTIGYYSLSFDITLKAVLGDSYVGVKFNDASSVQLNNIFYFKSGEFGLDGNVLTTQNIIIDSGSFNFVRSGNIFEVQIFVNKSFAGYQLDNINFNMGSSIDIPKVTGIEEAPIDGKVYSRSNKNWVESLNSGLITTSISITNDTLTDDNYKQEGKVIGINNGVNVINYTVNGNITASFVLLGTGSVTFVQGTGRTLIGSIKVLSGSIGSTASIVSFGTSDYLQINNI